MNEKLQIFIFQMARENYKIFNLNGKVEYIDKIENGYPVVEVHEFCCNSNTTYTPDVMTEGHSYDRETQEPNLLIRNYSFYCENHQ